MADVTLTHPDHDEHLVLDDVDDARRVRILTRQGWVPATTAHDGDVVDLDLTAPEG